MFEWMLIAELTYCGRWLSSIQEALSRLACYHIVPTKTGPKPELGILRVEFFMHKFLPKPSAGFRHWVDSLVAVEAN
jgi:hypothetical protein